MILIDTRPAMSDCGTRGGFDWYRQYRVGGQNSAKAKIIVATYYAGNNHTMNLSVTIRSLIQHPKTSYTVQLIMNVGFRM